MIEKLSDLFIKTGLCSSNKEFKRLVAQGGARVNDVLIEDPNLLVYRIGKVMVIGHWEEDKFIAHVAPLATNQE